MLHLQLWDRCLKDLEICLPLKVMMMKKAKTDQKSTLSMLRLVIINGSSVLKKSGKYGNLTKDIMTKKIVALEKAHSSMLSRTPVKRKNTNESEILIEHNEIFVVDNTF